MNALEKRITALESELRQLREEVESLREELAIQLPGREEKPMYRQFVEWTAVRPRFLFQKLLQLDQRLGQAEGALGLPVRTLQELEPDPPP